MAVNAPYGIDPTVLAALLNPLDPILLVPTAVPAVSGQLLGMEGVLQGWSLRETGGATLTQVDVSTSTATGAAINAVLPDAGGKQTFITGFDVTLGPPAAGALATVTVTGLTNNLSYDLFDQAVNGGVLSIRFAQPIPGAVITVGVTAVGGAAATNVVNAYGYQSGGTTAVLELYSGSSAGGELLATLVLQPGASSSQSLLAGALPFQGGLFLQVVSGSCKGTFWARV